MCGIFAYLNYKKQSELRRIIDILIKGLQRLEYRGYDSAGICIDHSDEQSPPYILKRKGHVRVLLEAAQANLAQIDLGKMVETHIGIAHTRWATHGPACDANAHPMPSDPHHEFVVVHNGIITNYATMKQVLCSKGFTFHSDTDTEVISVLLKFLYDEQTTTPRPGQESQLDFSQLVMEAMGQLEGAFALVVKSVRYPGEVVCCKRGSPLIVGIRREDEMYEQPSPSRVERPDHVPKELFFASDASAIIEHTRRVIYLDDEDVVHIVDGHMMMYNRVSNKQNQKLCRAARPVHQLEMELESIMKGSYDHFMLKEICEQPESFQNSLRGRVCYEPFSVKLGGFPAEVKRLILNSRRLVFVACGTSYYSALFARPILEELAEVPVTVELASDFIDRRPPVFRDDVCCFVSQSGETADTLRALEYCKERSAFLVGFTNTVGSAIARATHCGAHINAGCEIGVASTKAYTSQCAILLLLALLLSSDKLSMQERRRTIMEGLRELPALIQQALSLEERIKALALRMKDEKSILLMGRGYQYATCLEGALKIKELAYIHSEGILAGELKHGPLALIDENMPVIMVAPNDSVYPKVKSGLQQIRARHGRPIIFLTEPDPEMEAEDTECILIPKTVDCLQPILCIIPLQLFAYHLACLRGLDVDCPRNLAKSVTTE
eukprot:TRINITY_DN50026_c0_g1_i1.p1 TRINITY_DN50026_c0_g1~~TRINITY_DN50026_c0_g1_i1.p1  ORF type:complete len:704 (+),score=265.32 TRINITY_DN50026_c0_g1_i1:110-2113(+)